MLNHIADGRVLNVLATVAILSGSLVKVGDVVGVASTNIAPGESGSVQITAVYEVPKSAGAVAQGQKLYFDEDADALTTTAGDHTFAGHAYEAAAAGDATVRVRLIG
jgi:predicted RecA/RadA family phage recombinase